MFLPPVTIQAMVRATSAASAEQTYGSISGSGHPAMDKGISSLFFTSNRVP